MIKVLLKFVRLVDMSESIIKCWGAEPIMWVIMSTKLHIKRSHEEFIFKSNKSIWVFLLHYIEELQLFSDFVIDESSIGMNWMMQQVGTSLDEVFNWEERSVCELVTVWASALQTFTSHLRPSDSNKTEFLWRVLCP